MTHTDFNHILSSLEGLTPEQMRRLRQQLDRRARAAEGTDRSDAPQGRQTPRGCAAREEAADG